MELANENWRCKLNKNDIINAQDNDEIWYEAVVKEIDINKNEITLKFKGWSDKWNTTYELTSDSIKKRYEKVPSWIDTLEIGNYIEFMNNQNDDNLTWTTGLIYDINDEELSIIKYPNVEKIKININDNVAEPFTHCGYNNTSPSNFERKIFLNYMREIHLKKNIKKKETKTNYLKSIVANDLSKFINNKALSDIKFIFKDDRFIYAHKLIICSRSEYFNKMFLGNMSEMNLKEKKINDFNYDIYIEIMYYLYTGKPKDINNNNACDLLYFSNKYLLTGLKNQIVEFLKKYFEKNIEDKEDLLLLSDKFNLKL